MVLQRNKIACFVSGTALYRCAVTCMFCTFKEVGFTKYCGCDITQLLVVYFIWEVTIIR